MEISVAMLTQKAAAFWSQNICPVIQTTSQTAFALWGQIQSAPIVLSVASKALGFAATPLGMGLIGAVAVAAIIGAVILIRRRLAAPQAQPITPPPAHPLLSPTPFLPRPAAPLGPLGIQAPGALSTLMVARRAGLGLDRHGLAPNQPALVITTAELAAVLAHFSKVDQHQLQRLFNRSQANRLQAGFAAVPIIVTDNATTAQGSLALTAPEETSNGAIVAQSDSAAVNRDVVEALVGACQRALDQSESEAASQSPPKSPPRQHRSPSRRSPARGRQDRGIPLHLNRSSTVLRGQEAIDAASRKGMRLSLTTQQLIRKGQFYYDTTTGRFAHTGKA